MKPIRLPATRLPPAIIFSCARPISHNDENLLKILSYRKKDCILTDVGSVKTPINSLIHSLGLTDCFIGGHPMAGSERIGFANSKAGLLENAYYILAPAPQVPAAKIAEFQGLVTSMGAIPLQVESQKHDYVTAAVSPPASYRCCRPRPSGTGS